MNPAIFTSTPVMRYAVTPGDTGSIEYIDGLPEHWPTLPKEGDVLTVPFLVDRLSRLPVPVRVLEICNLPDMQPPTIAIVVGRQQ